MPTISPSTGGRTGSGDSMHLKPEAAAMIRSIGAPLQCLMVLCCLLMPAPLWGAPSSSDMQTGLPSVVEDATKAASCTVTYLVTDITTNDMLTVRMQITPDPNDRPRNNLMPCPPDIPPRVASRALDACVIRAGDPKNCVYADMSRGFEKRPNANNSAENSSRCSSDKMSDIGVACWVSGDLHVCGVGCGTSPASAVASAVSRCEAKHQQQCPITGSVPVLAPR
jgi:hypothetical protein